eukprot:TRINITY_DN842_c0_g1_i1.p1 TRINITY_DN842_c0_g1~~TRINITY_DN842_c0_g1_i1.p1  ORF type:complete len:114 (+),score=15.96 TRINITY_DN842_c0_g1_i1:179-520(+)
MKISALVVAVGSLIIIYALVEFTLDGLGYARKLNEKNFIAIYAIRGALSALTSLALILSINVQPGILSKKTSGSSSKDSPSIKDISLDDTRESKRDTEISTTDQTSKRDSEMV